ncbi:unnamed protein product [Dovyalis caffra]|uniref:Uncharacterized protein n=1 Tax=Dovyalis caffra TaxID=77055 RepID=A0AAV1SRZ3_9ROSI|nr:unnamed protein product [Dovyalis caffra]
MPITTPVAVRDDFISSKSAPAQLPSTNVTDSKDQSSKIEKMAILEAIFYKHLDMNVLSFASGCAKNEIELNPMLCLHKHANEEIRALVSLIFLMSRHDFSNVLDE